MEKIKIEIAPKSNFIVPFFMNFLAKLDIIINKSGMLNT